MPLKRHAKNGSSLLECKAFELGKANRMNQKKLGGDANAMPALDTAKVFAIALKASECEQY